VLGIDVFVIAVWLTTQQQQSSVAFLPVNPFLTPLRNQGRQKLATLDSSDFRQLLIDILSDTKRRQGLNGACVYVVCMCVFDICFVTAVHVH